jgi:alpha-glucosidase (family GH31 glycosyl hydrolase)
MYTLFYRSHTFGETVVRPLFFEFPTEFNSHSIDRQYLFGPALLVSPVLTPVSRQTVLSLFKF